MNRYRASNDNHRRLTLIGQLFVLVGLGVFVGMLVSAVSPSRDHAPNTSARSPQEAPSPAASFDLKG